MENENRKYVLITGATEGIGYELSKVFAENGFNLVLVARNASELHYRANELRGDYGIEAIPVAKDLFQPGAAFELYDQVRNLGLTVDILVNNAGQGVYGKFVETDIEKQLYIIQLNIASLTALTYLFLKDMVARNDGRILNLGSIASEVPHPLQAVYGGTKAYVLSFSEALFNEVKETNVTVTTLQPGATETDFFNKAGAQNAKIVQEGKLGDPAKVARDGFEALMKGRDSVVSGMKNKAMSTLAHIVPDKASAEQMHKQLKDVTKDQTD
jgi:short-subunit dehydrogenase